MLSPQSLTAPPAKRTIAPLMSTLRRVALLGLRPSEHELVANAFRLPGTGPHRFALAGMMDEADLLVADAADAPSVQLVRATDKLASTVFLGAAAPPGAVACLTRPLDRSELLRALNVLATGPGPGPGSGPRRSRQIERRAPPAPAPLALLVDDSEVALRYLETRLQRWGLVMERALSSGRAIELLAQRHYDFVFLDVELGPHSDLDGLALCQHIKRQQHRQALASSVVLVSAHHGHMDRVRGNLAGCDAYLAKPLDEVELQRLMLRHGLKPRVPSDRDTPQPI
jgi:two-component system cell cycle response regulator